MNRSLAVKAQAKGEIMSHRQLTGVSLAALLGAGTLFVAVTGAQAGMSPAPVRTNSSVQVVDCAVGAHIGPLGGCILGTDDRPVVVEHRSADAPDVRNDPGCTTKSIQRTDDAGNTETKTKTNC
jgi:hypothetical protein